MTTTTIAPAHPDKTPEIAEPIPPRIHCIRASDGHGIPVFEWIPERPVHSARTVVHICHGMAEHAGRYGHLAGVLNQAGYVVIAHDHRGHGAAGGDSVPGHFADHDGWDRVTGDIGFVQSWIRQRFEGSRIYLLGHSMGSFIAQGYLMRPDIEQFLSADGSSSNLMASASQTPVAGLILSGSSRDGHAKVNALRSLVAVEHLRQGGRGKSEAMRAMTFGAFAKTVTNRQSDFDWLSHDAGIVREFENDPRCGFDCSNQLWSDLGEGLTQIHGRKALKRIPKQLPILIISGAEDPVGAFGKGPRKLAKSYEDTGHADVLCAILPHMRHEPFNESNREEAEACLLQWLEDKERRHEGAHRPA